MIARPSTNTFRNVTTVNTKKRFSITNLNIWILLHFLSEQCLESLAYYALSSSLRHYKFNQNSQMHLLKLIKEKSYCPSFSSSNTAKRKNNNFCSNEITISCVFPVIRNKYYVLHFKSTMTI